MNSTEMNKTADEISLDRRFSESLCRFIDKNPDTILLLEKEEDGIKRKLFEKSDNYNLFLKENFDSDLHPILNLYHAVVFAGNCKAEYQRREIDPEVYKDTMSDINIWAASYYEKTGLIGLEDLGWIRHHLMCRIFRLGRLQFEMKSLEKKVKEYPAGTPCLDIHIPEGEKLDFERCRKSIEMAKSFFAKHFKESYRVATCHSWLLHENLKDILDQDSNIVRFASLFEIIENDKDNSQALERVFGDNMKISADIPELTSLQRKMKYFLLNGNEIGMGYGIIEF